MRILLIAFSLSASIASTASAQDDLGLLKPIESTQEGGEASTGITTPADRPRRAVSGSDENFFLRQAMLQREIRLLELEAKKKELQDEIAGKKEQQPSLLPGGPIIPVTEPPKPVAAAEPPAPVKPVEPVMPFTLMSIYGGEGVYRADVAVGAARVSVGRGSELPGGWVVKSVGQHEVVVQKGRQEKTLRIGG